MSSQRARCLLLLSFAASVLSSFMHGGTTLAHNRAAISCNTRRAAVVLVARPDDSVYDTLGVKRSASLDEVRTQFRKRAKDLHPDVNPAQDAAEQFRRLVSAFETIISFAASSESSDDDAEEAWGAGASSAWQRPAGSRRAAEADTPEASDLRRARWRQTLFEEMYREHMPFGYVNVPSPCISPFS